MFGSTILEVAIGVIFVYLFISLVCSAVNEIFSSIINKRGRNLFEGIKNLLNDPKFTGLAQQLYSHGLVDGISQGVADLKAHTRLPSYMPSNTFSLALIDLLGSKGAADNWQDAINQKQKDLDAATASLAKSPDDPDLKKKKDDAQVALGQANSLAKRAAAARAAHSSAEEAALNVTGHKDTEALAAASTALEKALALGRELAAKHPDPLGNIQTAVEQLPDGHTKESLLVLVDKTRRETTLITNEIVSTGQQVEKLRQNVEDWFNQAMDRVGGWYKRWTQFVLVIIAFIVVGVANVDTIALVKRFNRDNTLRASIVSVAEKVTAPSAGNPTTDTKARDELFKAADSLKLPLGWVVNTPPNETPEQKEYRLEQVPEDGLGWAVKICGLLISILAVSQGAPFWFDTLNKFVNLRGAGTPPGEPKKSAPQPAKS